ncbi:probable glutathione S-transferase parA [Papaver somniferum]|uniref:probable glutathione S-transferase parA n=1 Tax=Papaver somniferum TaxID=3469 RepID=UPI000E6F4EC3|nr:probable glutathione S-transferase parA [Papaver somniferum]
MDDILMTGDDVEEMWKNLIVIDDVWNDKFPLLPSDPYQKATARFWVDYIDKNVYAFGKKTWMTKGEEQEKAKKYLIETLRVLEGELGEKPYFGGENMGFLDVALVPYYSWFYSYEICGKFSIEDFCPKLVSWAKNCMEKESVSKSLLMETRVYGFVIDLKKFHGIDKHMKSLS